MGGKGVSGDSGQGLIFRMEKAFHALERGCVAMRACVRNPSLRGFELS